MTQSQVALCRAYLAAVLSLIASASPGTADSSLPETRPPFVPVPQPVERPQHFRSQRSQDMSGVSYVASTGLRPASTNLGVSAHEPVFAPAIWSGVYLGGHGAYARRDLRGGAPSWHNDQTSGSAGAHLGFNLQAGRFVFGGEADAGMNLGHGTTTIGGGALLTVERAWTASMRARAGVALGSVHIYGTAGIAVAGHRLSLDDASRWRLTDTTRGMVYGAGLEWRASERISLRGEVLRYEFGNRDLFAGGSARTLQLDETVVRGGLSYRFN